MAPLVGKVDTLVLGCTHYPLLRPIIQNVMGPSVKLIDSGAETVRDVSVLLNYFEINRSREVEDKTKNITPRLVCLVLKKSQNNG